MDTSRFLRGMAAGFGATVILSIFMLIKAAADIVPEANAIQALVKVSTIWLGTPLLPWIGWLEHFFIGTVLWGIAFAIVEPVLPGPGWLRGLIFSTGAWIVMMVTLLPAAGAGFFGAYLGWGTPVSALILHWIWGVSIGVIYESPPLHQLHFGHPART
ncbi:MAG: DUF6789 family protein [Alphaproteobacteria bacterium]